MGDSKNTDKEFIFDVANYFLSKESITPKKLQKIMYFAYAWFLYINSEDIDNLNPLFNEKPQAWVHGPVFRSIYDRYKDYKWNNIPKYTKKIKSIDEGTRKLLDKIWEKYGGFEADELEAVTHAEDPWRKARSGVGALEASSEEIDDREIFLYYEKIAR